MGEMRQSFGTMDGKYRILGKDSSATIRQKMAIHWNKDLWIDGYFGMKDKDQRIK